MDSEGNVIVENELEVKDKNISISKSTDADKAKYEGKIVTRTVIAENIYGIKSESWTFKFNADFTLPNITSTKVESKDENYDGWFNKTTLSLNGTCTDENSEISYVTYKLGEKEGEIYPSGENKEAFAANIGGFTEGSNILNLSVTDNAGNTQESKTTKVTTKALDKTSTYITLICIPIEKSEFHSLSISVELYSVLQFYYKTSMKQF